MKVEVRELVAAADIAAMFNVTPSAVSNWRVRHGTFPEPVAIVAGDQVALWRRRDIEAWATTPARPNARQPGPGRGKGRGSMVSPALVAEMQHLRDGGLTLRAIGDVVGVSHETVRALTKQRKDQRSPHVCEDSQPYR